MKSLPSSVLCCGVIVGVMIHGAGCPPGDAVVYAPVADGDRLG